VSGQNGRPVLVMTIGSLSRRTGVPVKTLRVYADLGLIYTVGRSAGNYRQFGEEALWCVAVVGALRELGLTLSEIQGLVSAYLADSVEPDGPGLAALLKTVRSRTEAQIVELRERLDRIDTFETHYADQLAGDASFRAHDPRHSPQKGLDSPSRGRA
jgi:MerR family copper efflux transcriptional regulator